MKKAYILHGCCDRDEYYSKTYPSPSNSHWIPWLQKELLVKGYQCQTPEMPVPYKPSYEAWREIFSSFAIDSETVLIGHSCGCGFLLKWLNKSGAKIDKLILVAPWLDHDRYMGDFLQIRMRPDLGTQINDIHIFYSEDEPVSGVKETVDQLLELFPQATFHEFDDKGHFTLEEMDTDQFPELLKVVTV